MDQVFFTKLKYKLKNRLRRHLMRPFAKHHSYHPQENHYIFADPRGGSTWMMEIIQHITQEPVIWEPLNLKDKNNPFNSIQFDWRQFIPPNENWPEAKYLFQLLFEGKILDKDILDHSTLHQLNQSDSLLFKFCRGNALLPWLVEHFEFHYLPIYFVRHPFAVVSSQLRHGAWSHLNRTFEVPNTPFNTHYKKHEDFLKTISSNEEILVAKWCLSNLSTLNHHNNNKKWICIIYEDFVHDPKVQLERVLKSWSTDYDLSKLNFQRDSRTTHRDSPRSGQDKISSWKNIFDASQIDRMGRVLDYFNSKLYIKNSPLPTFKFD
ncbi:MAG: hypothetical protein GVY20_14910 [Bacteroidetes bacterium]|jgi:hypothetical protein|nr:hypothetical protein [Bacteroidota bacterium]